MEDTLSGTRVVILAAGEGKRMKHHLPKVMVEIEGRPLIDYIVESVHQSNIDKKPIVVVSTNGESIRTYLNDAGRDVTFAVQKQQLGTGDAVKSALPHINDIQHVLVLYGDHPFIHSETIRALAGNHAKSGGMLSMLTVTVPDFTGDHSVYETWGRIIRNDAGDIERIVEYKDATDGERAVTEVNPAIFCFDTGWLRKNIETIGSDNAQHEFYLPDLVQIAMREGHRITSTPITPQEAIGVNTPKHIEIAKRLITPRAATQ